MDNLFGMASTVDHGRRRTDTDARPNGMAQDDGGMARPLAVRMRPETLDDVVGQDEALSNTSPLRAVAAPPSVMSGSAASSVILTGPPGVGKTTIARILASQSGRRFVELSATSSSVKDVKAAISEAARLRAEEHVETLLFIDEIHRFTKSQQDALLPGVENQDVVFVAATTENPSYSVIRPLLSRSVTIRLKALDDVALKSLVDRALESPRGFGGEVSLDDDAKSVLVDAGGGDGRKTLGLLEMVVNAVRGSRKDGGSVPGAGTDTTSSTGIDHTAATTKRRDADDPAMESDGGAVDSSMEAKEAGGTTKTPSAAVVHVVVDDVLAVLGNVSNVTYDRGGDDHYDMISAFIKSMRGSDAQAAVYWAARMLDAGEDPMFIARRVVIAAGEEVGLANPQALVVANAALQAVSQIGMPEARIILSEAILVVATSPKSNASYMAINKASKAIQSGMKGPVPLHLRNATSREKEALGYQRGYRYAHDWPYGIAAQEYLPAGCEDAEFYVPKPVGQEKDVIRRMDFIQPKLHPDRPIRGGGGTDEDPSAL